MDTKALRQKILDLAIRGKLVPQDPADEPASVLLERIRAEKQQMVKDGKLKPKDIKNDTVIYKGADNLHYEKFADGTIKCIEDEIPFDIPDGWSWTRLIAICPYGETTKINANNITDNEWILGLEDIEKDTGKILSYVLKSERQSVSQKNKFCKGQLLYSKLRPYLNKVLIAPKDGYCTSEILPLTLYGNISPEYIRTFLMSDTFLAYVDLISYGVKMPRLGTEDGKRSLIALPPLQEQFRIDTKLQETLEKIEYLKLHSNELEKIIKTIKSKILDLAIRGKLVEQDPNDEPASVLLERIRAEKEELIKQGKIKRNKKESVIFKGDDNSYYEKIGNKVNCIDEEIPFELPEGWAFIRLKTAWELISGRDLSPSDYNDKNDGIPYITGASNFKNGHVILVRWTPVPQVITRKGDLLLTCKGTIGKIAYNNFGEAHIARQIMAIRNNYGLNVDFLALCIEYSMTKIKQAAKGLIPGISREDILNLVIPIPPIKEQEKTCNKLKVIFSAIEHIENSLN